VAYEQAAYENADKKNGMLNNMVRSSVTLSKKIELEIIDKITAKNYGFKIQRIHQDNRHN